jgi:saccharopine dehydrogenase (NAD+, L-lysine-forming)
LRLLPATNSSTAQVFYFGHPEPITIPQTIKGVKVVTNKGGVLPPELNELLRVFAGVGLTSPTPIMVRGQEVAPRDFLVAYMASLPAEEVPPEHRLSAMTIEVGGKKEGIDVRYIYSGAASMGPGTGIPASIGAQMLGRGEINVKGVVAPEACIDPEPFMA